ncbi:Translin [Blastocladiella britannica]|nr:Translin [Blastocladiella britannica]
MFAHVQDLMDRESDLRDDIRSRVRSLDRILRNTHTCLSQAFSATANGQAIAAESQSLFDLAREELKQLKAVVPSGQYHRYASQFSNALQTAISLLAFRVYIASEDLLSIQQVEGAFDIPVETDLNTPLDFFVPLDDYLLAIASLPSELSRLAINSAAQRDYARPARILAFTQRVYQGFQTLNLKNDAVRRKYDSIKYDVKKIEEIVYDIRMRNLDAQQQAVSV